MNGPYTDLTRPPATDPSFLYRYRDELYVTDMLIAALREIDFFTWLEAHPGTNDDIAQHFGFYGRSVDVMTTLFVAMGFVERDGPVLRVTDVAREHPAASSRWFMGPYFPKVTDRPIAQDVIHVLRTGQPARFASRPDEEDWHRAMKTEAFAGGVPRGDGRARTAHGAGTGKEPGPRTPSTAPGHRRRVWHLCLFAGGALSGTTRDSARETASRSNRAPCRGIARVCRPRRRYRA